MRIAAILKWSRQLLRFKVHDRAWVLKRGQCCCRSVLSVDRRQQEQDTCRYGMVPTCNARQSGTVHWHATSNMHLFASFPRLWSSLELQKTALSLREKVPVVFFPLTEENTAYKPIPHGSAARGRQGLRWTLLYKIPAHGQSQGRETESVRP